MAESLYQICTRSTDFGIPDLALLVDWRRAGEGWEALVVEASATGICVCWVSSGDVVQVADDGVREV